MKLRVIDVQWLDVPCIRLVALPRTSVSIALRCIVLLYESCHVNDYVDGEEAE